LDDALGVCGQDRYWEGLKGCSEQIHFRWRPYTFLMTVLEAGISPERHINISDGKA
jgi:hypothetical protein